MCLDMCIDMCVNLCIDKCIDMYASIRVVAFYFYKTYLFS